MNIVDVKDRWRLDKKQSLQQKLINTAPPALKLCKQVFNHKNFMNGLVNKNGFQSGNGWKQFLERSIWSTFPRGYTKVTKEKSV